MTKKKILLRLDPEIHEQLRLWAERDFRSVNAQIEFLLKKALNIQSEEGKWINKMNLTYLLKSLVSFL